MDSDKNVSVWLKQLRNIVCRCQVGRFANEQLRVPALLTGTVLGRHAVRDSTTFGSVETPTMVGTKAMVSIVAVHAPTYADRPEDLLELMRELGSIPAKLLKAARGMASQTAGES